MCGICGYVEYEKEAGPQTLKTMSARIIHRGPDDEGFYQEGPAALAARRLSIIDLSTGHQPLPSHSRNSWITYNGEVYNFPELRRELEARGTVFRTRSDTEVVVNLYEEFGLDFAKKLRGMFAFAIYDSQQERLVLVRDRIGKKPLYYCLKANGNLIFGSEIKSILPYPGIDRSVDPVALDLYLTLEYVPAPYAIFSAIRKVPAGHMLVYEKGRLSITPYWHLEHETTARPLAALTEEFLTLLKEAVKIRMIADVPLGAFLSGGIDSSAIVAMMAKASGEPIKTFSIGFEEKSYSELPYAQAVADRFQTDHYVRHLSPDIRSLVLRLAEFGDEPLGDFSNFPTYLVSATAREKVTVVLSGDGGDEMFGGYEHYVAQKISRFLDCPPFRPLHPLLSKFSKLFPPSELKKGAVNRIKRYSEGFAHPWQNRHFRWMLFLTAAEKKRLYSTDFMQVEFLKDLYQRPPFEAYFSESLPFPGINRDLFLDVKSYLADDIMVKVDRMSMATSLEARAPFLDHRLAEFAFSLAPSLKVRGLTGKWFLKQALAGILPARNIFRQKEGFSIPIKNWLKRELKDLLMESLAPEKIRDLGLFNPATISTWIREHLENRENHSHRLWALIQFQLWAERFGR